MVKRGSLDTVYFESTTYDQSATATFYHLSPFTAALKYQLGDPWTITANTGTLIVTRYNTGADIGSQMEIDLSGLGAGAVGKLRAMISPDRSPTAN